MFTTTSDGDTDTAGPEFEVSIFTHPTDHVVYGIGGFADETTEFPQEEEQEERETPEPEMEPPPPPPEVTPEVFPPELQPETTTILIEVTAKPTTTTEEAVDQQDPLVSVPLKGTLLRTSLFAAQIALKGVSELIFALMTGRLSPETLRAFVEEEAKLGGDSANRKMLRELADRRVKSSKTGVQ